MSDFFDSVKADLLDRRLLPLLVLLGVALLGALAYGVLGGGGSVSPAGQAPLAAPAAPIAAASLPVSEVQTGAEQPVAETTSGTAHRTSAAARNPFAPLPGAAASSTATPASSGSSSPSTTSSGTPESSSSGTSATGGGQESNSKSTSGTGGGNSKPEANSPAEKKKSSTIYHVAVLFGEAPAGSPVPAPSLTAYENLKRQHPLPSAKQPLVVFRGVIAGGKSATFTLVGEAIPHGSGACLPSASQCQAIDLKPGQTEELEYLPPTGAAVIYQLQVVSIEPVKASAARAQHALSDESKSGLDVLHSLGLSALPGLRYSTAKGVLVFAGHPAFAARAHIAAWATALSG